MKIERENEEKMFSAFLQLKWINNHLVVPDDPWRLDRKLQQNARRIIQLNPTANERTLAEYWRNEYENLPTYPPQVKLGSKAKLHLAAYFEESCFWVAHKLAQKRSGKSSYSYLFQEYFQIARVIAANPEIILKDYDPSRSDSVKSVKNWGHTKLVTAILEITGEKTYSDAGLLRRQTKTSLERALEKEGVSSLTRYSLAWQSFQANYTPTTSTGSKQLLWPDSKQLEKIAAEYNEQANRKQLLPSMTGESINRLLKFCVQALRNSNEIQLAEVEDFGAIPDREMMYESDSGIEGFENTEIGECLSNAFTALPKEAQIILRLWHGLGFNQGDVGELFGIERNQIANKIKAWRSSLLRDLIKYLGQPMTAQEINQKSKNMDLWFTDYLREQFVYFLSITLNKELNGDVQLVQKCCNKGKFDLKAGANYLKITETEVSQRLEKLKEHLGYRLTDYVGSQLTAEVDQILYEALSTINLAKILTIDLVNQRLAEFINSVVRAKAEFLDEENQDIAKFVEEWLTKDKAGVK